jgi:hypothetical protein
VRAAFRSLLAAITVCPSPRHVNNGPNQAWSVVPHLRCGPDQESATKLHLHVRPHLTFVPRWKHQACDLGHATCDPHEMGDSCCIVASHTPCHGQGAQLPTHAAGVRRLLMPTRTRTRTRLPSN